MADNTVQKVDLLIGQTNFAPDEFVRNYRIRVNRLTSGPYSTVFEYSYNNGTTWKLLLPAPPVNYQAGDALIVDPNGNVVWGSALASYNFPENSLLYFNGERVAPLVGQPDMVVGMDSDGVLRFMEPMTISASVLNEMRQMVSIPFYGEATLNKKFGYFKPKIDMLLYGAQITCQDLAAGADVRIDVLSQSPELEQGKIMVLPAGAEYAETSFLSTLALPAGTEWRFKFKQVGSDPENPGGMFNLNLILGSDL